MSVDRYSRSDFLKLSYQCLSGVMIRPDRFNKLIPPYGPEASELSGVPVDMKLTETFGPNLHLSDINKIGRVNTVVTENLPLISKWFADEHKISIAAMDRLTFTSTKDTQIQKAGAVTEQWLIKMLIDSEPYDRKIDGYSFNALMIEDKGKHIFLPILNIHEAAYRMSFRPDNLLFVPTVETDLGNYEEVDSLQEGTLLFPPRIFGGEAYRDPKKDYKGQRLESWYLAYEDVKGNRVRQFSDPRNKERMVVNVSQNTKDIKIPGSRVSPNDFGWDNYPPIKDSYRVLPGYSLNIASHGLMAISLTESEEKAVAGYDSKKDLWVWRSV